MSATRTALAEIGTGLSHSKVRCRRFARDKPRKLKLTAIQGWVEQKCVLFAHTVKVGYTVLMERVYYHKVDGKYVETYKPDYEVVVLALKDAARRFRHVMFCLSPWSVEQFVDSYSGPKRRLYERAALVVSRGWNWLCVKKWAQYKAFIKVEKLPLFDNKRVVPRIIQPRQPEYNVLVGRYIKAAEKPIFHMITDMFDSQRPVVAKGMNVCDLADLLSANWGRFKNPCAIGLDMSRFDQHISQSALRWEHSRYLEVYQNSPELAKLLQYQLRNEGRLLCNDGMLKYTSMGGRGSGDMNTSLGNTLLMAAIVYQYLYDNRLLGVVQPMINGDDTVLFMESDIAGKFTAMPDFCKKIGFELTMEAPVYVLEEVSFCHMRWINAPRPRMVREYPLCIQKDLHSSLSLANESELYNLFTSIGQAGGVLCDGVPVLSSFYAALCRGRTAVMQDRYKALPMFEYLANQRDMSVGTTISPEARVSFYKAFGVWPEHQIALEQYYDSLPQFTVEWSTENDTKYLSMVSLDPARGWCAQRDQNGV